MKLEKQDLDWLQGFLKLTKADKMVVYQMQQFIQKYIDPKCLVICSHCSAEVQWASKRIKTWWETIGAPANQPKKRKKKDEVCLHNSDSQDSQNGETN